MCSRFENRASPEDLRSRFGLKDFPPFPASEVLHPTDATVVIAAGNRPLILRWGLPAPWDGKPLVNARGETLEAKPTFRPCLERRCLVPATAYFEWRQDGKARRKNRITPAGGGIVAFAGLMDDEGHFTIATCAPAPEIAHIHGRMPVILHPDAEAVWTDADLTFEQVRAVLVPYEAAPLEAEEEAPAAAAQGDLFG